MRAPFASRNRPMQDAGHPTIRADGVSSRTTRSALPSTRQDPGEKIVRRQVPLMPRKKREPEHRRGAVVVRGKADGDRRTEDQELLRSHPELEFRETDTWRTLRIMGEFVEGFDALADIGPAVSIFGSARIGRRNRYYGAARRLAA